MDRILALLPAGVTQNPLPYAFFFLLFFGFTLPICEEVAMALVGVTMRAAGTPFYLAAGVAILSIMVQDTLYFLIARTVGPKLIRHKWLARLIKPNSIESGERYFKRRGPIIVFSTRFVVGLRAPVILGAGFLRMHWPRFLVYDLLAALVMTPAWMFVGYSLGANFDSSVGAFSRVFAIIGPIAIFIGAIVIYRSVKADKAKVDAEVEDSDLDDVSSLEG